MSERRSFEEVRYDEYVVNGSGDICFRYGMWGHCGPECPLYGTRDGCKTDAQEQKEADNG
jgi:hypothetical protein